MSICGCSNRFSADPFCECSYLPCSQPCPSYSPCSQPCPSYPPCSKPCPPYPPPYPPPSPPSDLTFRSSYLEAIGNTQTVGSGVNITFDIDPDTLDIAGSDIEINQSGTAFTINRPGLYHVEWSLNLSPSTAAPVTVGLLENGDPASGLSNASPGGNFSSGALINVGSGDLPYVIRLHNFGVPISLVSPDVFQNTAASIRILRFADGASDR